MRMILILLIPAGPTRPTPKATSIKAKTITLPNTRRPKANQRASRSPP